MTKKHFIALADTIREHNHAMQGINSRHRFSDATIATLALFCLQQNGNFNRERWLSYIAGECGPCGGVIKPPSKPRYVTPERKLARRLEGK